MEGQNLSTPVWEADGWRRFFLSLGDCVLYGRAGTIFEKYENTPLGGASLYYGEEHVLIKKYNPPLNRSLRH
ncbi:hypothetical protein [Azospirillum argentinense]